MPNQHLYLYFHPYVFEEFAMNFRPPKNGAPTHGVSAGFERWLPVDADWILVR
jgi:hypothetical protein